LLNLFKKLSLRPDKFPKHVAVIMDGNGRWAQKRQLPRSLGHAKGLDSVQKIIQYAYEFKIQCLTLFAFSTENSGRPKKEISDLTILFDKTITGESKKILANNIKINILGDISFFPDNLQKKIQDLLIKTRKNNGLSLNIALNYGGRSEIVRSVNKVLSKKKLPKITEKDIERNLDTKDLPNVDLLIRTGGEKRLSNFLIWQLAYAELYFINSLWPEFNKNNFIDALLFYQSRNRRFGKLSK
jgi:undecaprenyl diphosphate synthase